MGIVISWKNLIKIFKNFTVQNAEIFAYQLLWLTFWPTFWLFAGWWIRIYRSQKRQILFLLIISLKNSFMWIRLRSPSEIDSSPKELLDIRLLPTLYHLYPHELTFLPSLTLLRLIISRLLISGFFTILMIF